MGGQPRSLLPAACAQEALLLRGSGCAGGPLSSTCTDEHTQAPSLWRCLGLREGKRRLAQVWHFSSLPHRRPTGTGFQQHSDHISKPSLPVPWSKGLCVSLGCPFFVRMWNCLGHSREGASGHMKQASLKKGMYKPPPAPTQPPVQMRGPGSKN